MTRVAVIEDSEDIRLIVRFMLEPVFQVTEYGTAAAALAGLRREPADVVLLDLTLPDLDGEETLKRLRADAALAPLKVVAFTAESGLGVREQLLAQGFDEYYSKPIEDEAEFIALLQRLAASGR